MKRLVWMLVFAAAVWAGYELQSKGVEGAFGGRLAGYLQPIRPDGATPENFEPPH
jgi:hypothetical protein